MRIGQSAQELENNLGVVRLERNAMLCAFCREEIDRLSAWRSSSGRLYCSEFCADEYGLEPKNTSLPAPGTIRLGASPPVVGSVAP
jgi:hypothetical protein